MFKWLFVTLVLAFAIYLGMFDVLLKPKTPPTAPPGEPINTRSSAEDFCGKNNITAVEEITGDSKDAGFFCSDWLPKRGPSP